MKNNNRIFAKLITDEETGLNRWYLKRRFNVGSWHGSAPIGGVIYPMGMLDLKTGEYILHRPKNIIP